MTASDILVALPTFNNAQTLGKVIQEVRQHSNKILVVNDGSTDQTRDILAKEQGIEIIHLPVNTGKGAALLTAMHYARNNGFKTLIALDTDGQHAPHDLPIMMNAVAAHPSSIIIGDRQFDPRMEGHVPRASRIGRAISDFWVRVETGHPVKDTQSGFRAYPVQKLQLDRLKKKRFDFEAEVLVRSKWQGVDIRSVPISVFYPKPTERVSHFDPWRDNVRLTFLHACLCISRFASLLRLRHD